MDLVSGAWVYIVTNRANGTLYVGVTSDLTRRVWEHREGVADGFTKKYGLKRLVWAERHEDIRAAIQREHNLKHWPRAWKVQLVLAGNPAGTTFTINSREHVDAHGSRPRLSGCRMTVSILVIIVITGLDPVIQALSPFR